MGNYIRYMKEKHQLIETAQKLGIKVSKVNDRAVSIAPGTHTHSDAFVITDEDHWFDHTLNKGGDVIDLVALVKYNGNYDLAYQELGEGYTPDEASASRYESYKAAMSELERNVIFWHSELRPQDRDYLHSRRITDETIDTLKIGYSKNQDRLMIPFFMNGRPCYWIGRDCSPAGTLDENGNPRPKYKKCKTDEYIRNSIWGMDSLRRKTDDKKAKYIVIGEGSVDMISFWQEGYKVLSPMCGVFSQEQLPIVRDLVRANCECVILAFDSDKAGREFTKKMGSVLLSWGVKFICAILPEGCKDINEYYADGGNLDSLVRDAVDGEGYLSQLFLSDDDEDSFLETLCSYASGLEDVKELKSFIKRVSVHLEREDVYTLCYSCKNIEKGYLKQLLHSVLSGPSERLCADRIRNAHQIVYIDNDAFYEYIPSGIWKRLSDLQVKCYLSAQLGRRGSNAKVSAVTNLLRAACFQELKFNQKNLVVLKNGTLNLDTLEFTEHNPSDMATIQMTYDYVPGAKCDAWRKFIAEVMSGNINKMLLLQEMCGYVYFTDNCLEKAFMLMGSGANGKSVFLAVLRELFGAANCVSLDLSRLGKPFEGIHLKDKLVNLSSESGTRFNDSEEMFKKIISGKDAIHDSYKGKDSIEFIPRVKCFFVGNSYTTSNNINFAILRRMLFIEFEEVFTGERADPHLLEKLLQELPGIFNWVLEGYKRLRKNMKFTDTAEHHIISQDFLLSTSPIDAFLDDEMENLQMMGKQSLDVFYLKYCEWCKNSGYMSKNRGNFRNCLKNNLRLHFPKLKKSDLGDMKELNFAALERFKEDESESRPRSLEEFSKLSAADIMPHEDIAAALAVVESDHTRKLNALLKSPYELEQERREHEKYVRQQEKSKSEQAVQNETQPSQPAQTFTRVIYMDDDSEQTKKIESQPLQPGERRVYIDRLTPAEEAESQKNLRACLVRWAGGETQYKNLHEWFIPQYKGEEADAERAFRIFLRYYWPIRDKKLSFGDFFRRIIDDVVHDVETEKRLESGGFKTEADRIEWEKKNEAERIARVKSGQGKK